MEKETPHPSKLPSAQQTFRPFDRYDSLNGIAAKRGRGKPLESK
jgi:hypothetical protein